MPIWLRRFTFNKIQEWYENQNKDKQPENSSKINRPAVDPTYKFKAPKK